MLRWILEEVLVDKAVLDMGCGTAVLAILAKMRGANKVWAVDIDEWCYVNAKENILVNAVDTIQVFQGGAEVVDNEKFDVIFANINLNVLLEYMPQYVACLSKNGILFMSGFIYQICLTYMILPLSLVYGKLDTKKKIIGLR